MGNQEYNSLTNSCLAEAGSGRRVRGTQQGRRVTFYFNKQPVDAYENESVAAALLAAGHRVFRHTDAAGEPRGLFCGMGVCHECVVRIDGLRTILACQTIVSDGMRVESRWTTDGRAQKV